MYLTFLDDIHLLLFGAVKGTSWMYLTFLDDIHHKGDAGNNGNGWMYLTFLDDIHLIVMRAQFFLVGCTSLF